LLHLLFFLFPLHHPKALTQNARMGVADYRDGNYAERCGAGYCTGYGLTSTKSSERPGEPPSNERTQEFKNPLVFHGWMDMLQGCGPKIAQ
jgi:hypothetical protein